MAKKPKPKKGTSHGTHFARKPRGKETGMGICSFISALFEANELLPARKKLSDEIILKKVLSEFPCRKGKIGPNTKNTIGVYRALYNEGRFTGGIPPEKPSFRYTHGIAVDGRYGRRPLLPEEVTSFLRKHEALRAKVLQKLSA